MGDDAAELAVEEGIVMGIAMGILEVLGRPIGELVTEWPSRLR